MAMDRLQSRVFRSISDLRYGVLAVILSGILILSGCQQQTEPTSPVTDDTRVATDAAGFKPQSVIDVVRVQPFQLEQSFKYDWRRDRPDVRSGLLVVFKVNPELVVPRNALEPVLYAGNQTVRRLNHGHESGFVIGIIPGEIDLSQQPVWFGTPALPERIGAETIAEERAKAERTGISPLTSTDIQGRTQDPVTAADLSALLRQHGAELVLEFSPQEKRLAESWRLPVTGQ